MKRMRKIVSIICAGLLAGSLYPRLTRVVKVNKRMDTVICRDSNGDLWEFFGAEDWHEGDLCNMILYTMGTTSIYDDVIISTKYEAEV